MRITGVQRTYLIVLGLAVTGSAVAIVLRNWDALIGGWIGLGLTWLTWRLKST
ncbi:MAG: hypothetical protein ACREXJ_00225 [Gammaproteobacteria bacterium]